MAHENKVHAKAEKVHLIKLEIKTDGNNEKLQDTSVKADKKISGSKNIEEHSPQSTPGKNK